MSRGDHEDSRQDRGGHAGAQGQYIDHMDAREGRRRHAVAQEDHEGHSDAQGDGGDKRNPAAATEDRWPPRGALTATWTPPGAREEHKNDRHGRRRYAAAQGAAKAVRTPGWPEQDQKMPAMAAEDILLLWEATKVMRTPRGPGGGQEDARRGRRR
mmetsp:Transcript_46665/g.91160  ORF Transcript_46665/g.91160 Transcript_46665/m.91160 type:complete len:156 (+) Transcript_46665:73-540(+)|eukprot:CAMPEP_0194345808 /NCGR_PEP_ID=MMETSP0171-20130528/105061_1 /TAXON_ID=218684 /ORGANISM="Corethron pennatum, Strain L29A3" /LENGTH=155 /DNA_ID=CAMNT_0039112835 /DNA_START=564 /DNA_END=1031 /DNA_ORIENTATION=-